MCVSYLWLRRNCVIEIFQSDWVIEDLLLQWQISNRLVWRAGSIIKIHLLYNWQAWLWSVCFNPTFLRPATTYIIGTQISSNLAPGGHPVDRRRAVWKKPPEEIPDVCPGCNIDPDQNISTPLKFSFHELANLKAFHLKRCLNYQSKAILGLQWQQKAMNSKCGSSMFWPKVRLPGNQDQLNNWFLPEESLGQSCDGEDLSSSPPFSDS